MPASRGPIGRPISHTRAWVVDTDGRLAGIGVPGELLLGGEGLAWGYLNQPGLTARRFVPDPFGAGPGGRLYRTGDRARWRPDGTLEFLGRADHQVKIRGFRIEPGEVEAAILTHPAAQACVVVSAHGQDDVVSLSGYVQPAARHGMDAAGLRDYLAARLPAYLVPSALVILDRLPLNANGKVDRAALPPPEPARRADGRTAPGDPVEEVLAGIWAQVLNLDQVGVHDDFFAIGGHSLRAAQVTARVERTLRTRLSVRQLFEHSTVAALADWLRSESDDSRRIAAVAAVVLSVRRLSPAERRTELHRPEGEI